MNALRIPSAFALILVLAPTAQAQDVPVTIENVPAIRSGFEAAVERYPSNGRLHVAFATWVLNSRTSLSGWQDPDAPGSLKDPLPVAEKHMLRGMELEPELTWPALEALRVHRIPPERWVALTPSAPNTARGSAHAATTQPGPRHRAPCSGLRCSGWCSRESFWTTF